MENLTTNSTKDLQEVETLTMDKQAYNESYYELLNYLTVVKGLFYTEAVDDFLGSIHKELNFQEQEQLTGFYSAMLLLCDNAGKILEKMDNSIIRNNIKGTDL